MDDLFNKIKWTNLGWNPPERDVGIMEGFYEVEVDDDATDGLVLDAYYGLSKLDQELLIERAQKMFAEQAEP